MSLLKSVFMVCKTIVELFEENELAVSRLYAVCAKKFPRHRVFWSKLSQEELDHAKQVKQVKKNNGSEKYFETSKFARGIIRYVGDYIKEQTDAVEKNKLTHVHALNIALRVERSALENKSIEIFLPDNTLVKDFLKKMNRETSQHIKVITKELERQQ